MICPTHGAELEKAKLTQGEGRSEVLLGYLWICPADKECDYCWDADENGDPVFDNLFNEKKESV
jgi:hypothetical protein